MERGAADRGGREEKVPAGLGTRQGPAGTLRTGQHGSPAEGPVRRWLPAYQWQPRVGRALWPACEALTGCTQGRGQCQCPHVTQGKPPPLSFHASCLGSWCEGLGDLQGEWRGCLSAIRRRAGGAGTGPATRMPWTEGRRPLPACRQTSGIPPAHGCGLGTDTPRWTAARASARAQRPCPQCSPSREARPCWSRHRVCFHCREAPLPLQVLADPLALLAAPAPQTWPVSRCQHWQFQRNLVGPHRGARRWVATPALGAHSWKGTCNVRSARAPEAEGGRV